MKHIYLTLIVVCTSIFTSSVCAQHPTTWTTYFENDTIQIDYKESKCPADNFEAGNIFFKITNKIDVSVKISFDQVIWYNDTCYNCEKYYPNYFRELELLPFETFESDCQLKGNFNIQSTFYGDWKKILGYKPEQLTKFELQNIKTISYE